MNEVQYDRGKYTDPYVDDLCIRILHFVWKITTQQLGLWNETSCSSEKLLAEVDVS